MVYILTKAVTLRLLVARRPCHAVIAVLSGIAQHPLHGQLVPVLFKGSGRYATAANGLPEPFCQGSIITLDGIGDIIRVVLHTLACDGKPLDDLIGYSVE